jgi:hypothetical protein
MDLREIGFGGVDGIRLAQDRGPVAGYGECSDEPSGSCTMELVRWNFEFQVNHSRYEYLT